MPAEVVHEGMEYSVTRIGSYSFSGYSTLTAVVIPNAVTKMEGQGGKDLSNRGRTLRPTPKTLAAGTDRLEGLPLLFRIADL